MRVGRFTALLFISLLTVGAACAQTWEEPIRPWRAGP